MINWHGTRVWQAATAGVGVVAIVVFVTGGVFLAASNSSLSTELAESHKDTRAATANADSSYQQLIAEGIKPAAEKPAEAVAGNAGKTGNDGEPGRPPTAGEVASAVATYCTIRLDCTGATGAAGPVSLVPGPIGDTGADSTVSGPMGETGPASTVPGPVGLTGTGIASILCQDDGYWLFTLTQPDGTTTTQTVAGPCRVDPITTPPTQGVTP